MEQTFQNPVLMEITISNRFGLHLRAAKCIMDEACNFVCDIYLSPKSDPSNRVNAKSLLGIISIGVSCGDTIVMEAYGKDADRALSSIREAIKTLIN